MQTWAKRGIKTALVTGGLLMLGTGIASAEDNVNPDRPASPLDASVIVPIKIDNNALGSPLGNQADLPEFTREVRVTPSDLTGGLPDMAANPLTQRAQAAAQDDLLRGNKVTGDVVVPVDISGNAIAVIGDAAVENDSTQTVTNSSPVTTDGSGSGLAGNVVNLDYALPVQITGNAISGLGTAATSNTASQVAETGGDIETAGTGGALSGNVAAVQGATPVQVNGNAIAAGGVSQAESDTSTDALADGTLTSDGVGGAGSGNVAGAPVALPVEVNGQSASLVGNAWAGTDNVATAQAGDTAPGIADRENYIVTDGTAGALSGSGIEPAVAGPAAVNCNAATLVGNVASECTTESPTTAGGDITTLGEEGTLTGTVAQAPVALPVNGFSNAAAVGGNAAAATDNTTDSTAGGHSFTHGDDSVGGGTVATTPVAAPVDLCSTVAGGVGQAGAECVNTNTTDAGGFTGSNGNDSVAGGNNATVPVALPVEPLGTGAGVVGSAETVTDETKVVTSGGETNTDDDNGTLASNVAQVPVSGPVQAFANAANVVGNADAESETDTVVKAGGNSIAKGDGGSLSGNIAQAPVAIPTQVFATGASAGGNGESTASADTTSTSGGNAHTTGAGGAGSGNIASVPVGSAVQAYSESAAALGMQHAAADSTTDSTAGGVATTTGEAGTIAGNVVSPQALPLVQSFGAAASGVGGQNQTEAVNDTTTGEAGTIAGNVVSPQALPLVQSFGAAASGVGGQNQTEAVNDTTTGEAGTIAGNVVSPQALPLVQSFGAAASGVGGQNQTEAVNDTTGDSGGDIVTNGDFGFLSGNLVDVPAAAVAQPHGDAVAAVGSISEANSDSDTTGSAGGVSTTSGDFGSLSGIDGTVPVGVDAPVYDVPVEVLADAIANGHDVRDITVGEDGPALELPPTGGLEATSLPTMPRSMARTASANPLSMVLGKVLGGGALGGLPTTGLPTAGLPTAGLPTGMPTADLPTTGAPTTGLPTGLPTTGLPTAGLPTAGLPTNVLSGGMKTLPAPRKAAPAMPGLDNLTGVFKGNLVQAPSLDRLPVQTPQLSGVKLPTAMPTTGATDNASLSDTQSKLAGLFGKSPIG